MSRPNWIVKKVTPENNYILELVFEDGKVKKYDMKPYLEKGVFQRLKDPEFFKTVKVTGPTIAWGDEIDLAPETLYEKGIAA